METVDDVKQNWHRRADVFEILHFLAQFENPGVNAQEIRELRGEGRLSEIKDILKALKDADVVESSEVDGDTEYWLNTEIFASLASKRWAKDLTERQEKFINSFSMKYLDDRKKGTLRRMITESMVQGIYEKRNELENEIVELAGKLSLEDEAYSNPGIYAELAIREME